MALLDEWKAWRALPFPRDPSVSTDVGFELRSIDSAAAGCLDTYFARGRLDDERVRILEACVRDLHLLLPGLPSDTSRYFNELAALCRGVLGAVDRRN
jgi:hypothetical protein